MSEGERAVFSTAPLHVYPWRFIHLLQFLRLSSHAAAFPGLSREFHPTSTHECLFTSYSFATKKPSHKLKPLTSCVFTPISHCCPSPEFGPFLITDLSAVGFRRNHQTCTHQTCDWREFIAAESEHAVKKCQRSCWLCQADAHH